MTLDYVAPVTFVLVILLSQETFSLKCQTEGCTVRTECRSGLGNTIQINKIHREIESNKKNTEAGFSTALVNQVAGKSEIKFWQESADGWLSQLKVACMEQLENYSNKHVINRWQGEWSVYPMKWTIFSAEVWSKQLFVVTRFPHHHNSPRSQYDQTDRTERPNRLNNSKKNRLHRN